MARWAELAMREDRLELEETPEQSQLAWRALKRGTASLSTRLGW